jgi:imidazolonepropionase-like amidohydrolase
MMRLGAVALAGLLTLPLVPRSDSVPVVLLNASVVDTAAGRIEPEMAVVLVGDRIAEVVPVRLWRPSERSQIIDVRGKFLIPGLWDMHAHPFLPGPGLPPDLLLSLYLANGVTGLRDPAGPLAEQVRVRADIENGRLLAPRLVVSGPVVDGPQPFWPSFISVRSKEDGRRAVASLKQGGADFIKVYDLLPRSIYRAIADEARKQGMPFAGHVPQLVGAFEAADAGQRSFEHFIGFFEAASSRSAELREDALTAIRAAATADGHTDAPRLVRDLLRIEKEAQRTYSEGRAKALFETLVKNGTCVDPTLIAYSIETGEFSFTDPRLRYVRDALKSMWDPRRYPPTQAYTADDFATAKALFGKRLDFVQAMRRAGVKVVTGTDSPTVAYTFAGFSLHDELALLVRAGFTPLEALQGATLHAAECLDRSNRFGSIGAGKAADLVILDDNPLTEIGNTRKIHAVVVNGRVLPRPELDLMLAKAEAAAAGRR